MTNIKKFVIDLYTEFGLEIADFITFDENKKFVTKRNEYFSNKLISSPNELKKLTCSFGSLVYLLGDWLTYNELACYLDESFIDLAIGTKLYDDNILVAQKLGYQKVKYGSNLVMELIAIVCQQLGCC